MSEETDINVVFNFEEAGDYQSRLNALAKSVEATQKAMVNSVAEVGEKAIRESKRVSSATGTSAGDKRIGGGMFDASRRAAQERAEQLRIEVAAEKQLLAARGNQPLWKTIAEERKARMDVAEAVKQEVAQKKELAKVQKEITGGMSMRDSFRRPGAGPGPGPSGPSGPSDHDFWEKTKRNLKDEVFGRNKVESAIRKQNLALEDLADEQRAVAQVSRMASEYQQLAQDQIVQGGEIAAASFGRMARAAALFGFASGESSEKTLRSLAQVQGAIDLVSGAYRGLTAVKGILDGVRTWIIAKTLASKADATATALQTRASQLRTAALVRETVATRGLTGATGQLTAARNLSLGGGLARAGRVGRVGALRGARGLAGLVGAQGAVGGIGTASLGTVGLAAGAAAGGAAFGATSIYQTGKEMYNHGFGKAEVGGYTDTIGTYVAKFFDGIEDMSGGFIKAEIASHGLTQSINDEETARFAAMVHERIQRQQHLDEMRAIEIGSAMKLEAATAKFEESMADLAVRQERTTEGKQRVLGERGATIADQLAAARSALGVGADGSFDYSLRGSADEQAEAQKAMAAYARAQEQQIANQEQQIKMARQYSREQQQSLMQEVKAIEDVIAARHREADAVKGVIQTASEQFVDLSKGERSGFLRSLQKARTDPSSLTGRDFQNIGRVQTTETQRIIAEEKRRRAVALGFDEKVGGEDVAKLASLQKDEADAKKALADKTGIGLEEINQAQQNNPRQVELIDRRQIQATFELEEDRIVAKMFDAIREARAEQEARIKVLIAAELDRDRANAQAAEQRRRQESQGDK